MKNILETILVKFSALSMMCIIVIVNYFMDKHMYIDSTISNLQILLGLEFVIMPIVGTAISFIENGILINVSRRWKLFNIACYIIFSMVGLFLLYDIKERPFITDEYNKPVLISQTDSSIILEFTNKNIARCNTNEVRTDSLNPIKVYESYRIDIFGKKMSGNVCIKTNLMNDYVYPQFVRLMLVVVKYRDANYDKYTVTPDVDVLSITEYVESEYRIESTPSMGSNDDSIAEHGAASVIKLTDPTLTTWKDAASKNADGRCLLVDTDHPKLLIGKTELGLKIMLAAKEYIRDSKINTIIN